jgi:hypothetical protein
LIAGAVILQFAIISRAQLLSGYADILLVILAAWAFRTLRSPWRGLWWERYSLRLFHICRGRCFIATFCGLFRALQAHLQVPWLHVRSHPSWDINLPLHILCYIKSFRHTFTCDAGHWLDYTAQSLTEHDLGCTCLYLYPGYILLGVSFSRINMSSIERTKPSRFEIPRLVVVYGVMAVVFLTLLGRLLAFQFFETTSWIDQAVENYTKAVSSPALRGIIYDRNGFVLARNTASYNVIITQPNSR